jgi:transcription initiation factor IIE alpha subunit
LTPKIQNEKTGDLPLPKEKILELVETTFGYPAREVMDLILRAHLAGKRISENKIAKLLNMDVHDVRRILYQLQNLGIIYSQFWKINKKGWQINSWHFHENGFLKFLSSQKPSSDEKFSPYFCPVCGEEFSEEEALENNYLCPSCNEIVIPKENYQIEKKEIESLAVETAKDFE